MLPKLRKNQANGGATVAGLPPRRAEGWLIVEPLGQVVRGVAIATEIEGFLQHLPSSFVRWAPQARGVLRNVPCEFLSVNAHLLCRRKIS